MLLGAGLVGLLEKARNLRNRGESPSLTSQTFWTSGFDLRMLLVRRAIPNTGTPTFACGLEEQELVGS